MKLDLPDISPFEARQAMELAKKIFAKYKFSQQDQDLLYNAILTMGIAAMVSTRTDELVRQLGNKTDENEVNK
jgi:hypothetical protein